MTAATAELPPLIKEREYGCQDWRFYQKRIWNQVYTHVDKPMLFEHFLYNRAGDITDGQYTGGQWEAVEIVSGGFYFRPVSDHNWNCHSDAYQREFEMTNDGFGLALSILIFANYQSFVGRPSEYLTQLYNNCRNVVWDDCQPHPEQTNIFYLID